MSIADEITASVRKVTKKWTAQRKREEREAGAGHFRDEFLDDDRPMRQSEVADMVIPRAYAAASDNGRLPAHARQIYYAARAEIETMSGRRLDSV